VMGVWDIDSTEFERNSSEIVVDNDSPDFRLRIPGDKLLRRYLYRELPYQENWQGLAPVMKRWNRMFGGTCHGILERSAYVKSAGTGSFSVEWTTNIPESGRYDIRVWIPRPEVGLIYNKAQYYKVSGEGVPAKEVLLPLTAGEWISLGEFDLQTGKSTVVLDDRSFKDKKQSAQSSRTSASVIADAVKWVRMED